MTKNAEAKTDKKLVLITVIISVFLIFTIVLLFVVARKDEALQGADQAIKLSAQGGFNCEYAEAQKLYAFGEGILKVTGDRVAYLTLSGNEVFSNSVNFSNPQAYIKGDKAIVFDMNGYGFVLLDHEHVIMDKPTQNKIKSATLANDDKVAIITDSSDAYGEVIIYTYSENNVYEWGWTSYNSGYPLSVTFNNDSTLFAVTTLSTSGAVYEPFIRLFTLTKPETGTYEDYATHSVEEVTMFASAMYCEDTLFTFSADSIYILGNNKDSVLTRLDLDLGAINQVNCVDDMIYVVHSDGVDQVNKLAILNSNGEVIYDSPVGNDIKAVALSNNLYALSIDRRIYVYNTNGDIQSDIEVDEDVLRIGFIGNNKLVVISTSGVHTVDY